MGCKGSKLDDQEAVALCRGRAVLLAAALRHRHALAESHAALADSIESVAAPLHRLLRLQQAETLPSERKGGSEPSSSARRPDPSRRRRPARLPAASPSSWYGYTLRSLAPTAPL